ncbi:MAG TPA: phage virion morphogenesis protein [Solirubrobacterales bacterium]
MPITNAYRSGPRMSLGFEGLDASSEMLRDAAARGEDMRPAMGRIKLLLVEGHERQFESKGDYFGTPWPADSPATITRKAREGVPSLSDTLVSRGDLQAALSGGPGSRSRVSRGSVSVGVSTFTAIFTQGGASGSRRGDQPARPIVGVAAPEQEASRRILLSYLVNGR